LLFILELALNPGEIWEETGFLRISRKSDLLYWPYFIMSVVAIERYATLALLNQGMKRINLKFRSFVDTGFYDVHI
jgi:hypothetical protein